MYRDSDSIRIAAKFLDAILILIPLFLITWVSFKFINLSIIPSLNDYLLYTAMLTNKATTSNAINRYFCL
jgi:hypothetical protein